MNTQSYSCTYKLLSPDLEWDEKLSAIGDFSWLRDEAGTVTTLVINAPAAGGGSRGIVGVPVKQGPNEAGRFWGWDGNLEQPTLTPSIHWIEHWHGFLRAGRLESC